MRKAKSYADWRELPLIMRPVEVAKLLGVCTKTVLDQLRAGTLPGIKVGTQWRISKAALMEHLGCQQNGNAVRGKETFVQIDVTTLRNPDGSFLPSVPLYVKAQVPGR